MTTVFEKPRSLTDAVLHYCPGCTHGIVHRLVAECIDELGIEGRTIGIAPVGCSVFAYNYFNCDMVEAAHGRAPAVATGISECVGGLIPLIYFIMPNKSLLRVVKTKLDIKAILQACGNGSSELMSNISSSVVGMLYNIQLGRLAGENGIAAYGVLMYVQFVFIAIFIGYSIGVAPIIGYNYGAQNYAELKSMRKKSMLIMGVLGVILSAVAFCFAKPLAKIFVSYDAELLALTVRAFKIYAIHFLLCGFNIFASGFFTALNNGGVSAAISFLRTLVFQSAAVIIMPIMFGVNGIWWAVVVAEVCAFIISTTFLIIKRKKYNY